MKSILSKKVRLGRISVPVWTSVIALAVMGLAAGQAVGPVLAGSVTGTTGLTIEQAITLDTAYDLGDNPTVSGDDDAVTTRNDEGTEFTIAIELNVGERVTAVFNMQNHSDADAAAILELDVPAGIDVELVSEDSEIGEAQMARGVWLMTFEDGVGNAEDSEGNDEFELRIEPKDDLKPGFYTITGRLVQIGG